MKKLRLYKGDKVWVKLPDNAIIVGKDKQRGYILQTKDGMRWSYFDDDDVVLVERKDPLSVLIK